MAKSSRFIVAVHVLTLLAHQHGPVLASDFIAGSVNTNPVVIRRILGLLKKAGLVVSTEGAGGGAALAKPTNRVTLAEVYKAVEPETVLFASPRSDPNPHCPVGRCVQTVTKRHLKAVETAMEREMKRTTLADVLADVKKDKR